MNPAVSPDKEATFFATPTIKFSIIRRSPQSLYLDISKWMASLNIKKIISHQMSESNGYITITLFYE